MSTEPAPPVAPEPDRARVARWVPIIAKGLAFALVVLVVASIGLYFSVRAPTTTLNGFLSDLRARRDAHAWTLLCRADQREVPQAEFVADWQRQRSRYGAVISEIDAFSFEPFGAVRHFHYRLSFRDGRVSPSTYAVDMVHEDGRWKVCRFFALSRNPARRGVLSGFQDS